MYLLEAPFVVAERATQTRRNAVARPSGASESGSEFRPYPKHFSAITTLTRMTTLRGVMLINIKLNENIMELGVLQKSSFLGNRCRAYSFHLGNGISAFRK
jgi:hypothetical protein